jgi:hypothetical protein
MLTGGTMTGGGGTTRYDALKATSGFAKGTVGDSVHNAISTISMAGTFCERQIGRVFTSAEAKKTVQVAADQGEFSFDRKHGARLLETAGHGGEQMQLGGVITLPP